MLSYIKAAMDPGDFLSSPVYRKALEVFRISRAVACELSDNLHVWEMEGSAEFKHRFAGEIVSDSLNLAPGLAMLKSAPGYSLKSKNVQNIKRRVHRMLSRCKKLELMGVKQKEFLSLLRMEIYQFDKLFSEWLQDRQSGKSKD